jgi:hypothetical protein
MKVVSDGGSAVRTVTQALAGPKNRLAFHRI